MEPADVSGIADELDVSGACRVVAADDGLVAGVLVGNRTLIWTSRDAVSWEFGESLEVSSGSVGALGYRVPLAAVGRHVLLAGYRSDPAEPDGSRDVLLVGVVEP